MVTYWLTVDGGRFLFSRHTICGRTAEFEVHMNLFLVVAGVCFRMTCLNWKENIRTYVTVLAKAAQEGSEPCALEHSVRRT